MSKGNGSMQGYGDSPRSIIAEFGRVAEPSEVQMSESYGLDVINLEELIGAPSRCTLSCMRFPSLPADVVRRKHIHHCVIIKCSPVIEPKGDGWVFMRLRNCCHCVRTLESRTPNQSDHGYCICTILKLDLHAFPMLPSSMEHKCLYWYRTRKHEQSETARACRRGVSRKL